MPPNDTARLIVASSESCSDLFWTTKFYVPDPIVYFEHRGRKFLLASDLELDRAKKEAEVDRVLSQQTYESKVQNNGTKPRPGALLDLLFRERKIKVLQVPSYFPIQQAEVLKKRGYKIQVIPDPFYPKRQVKTQEEKRSIIKTLRATEAGIQAAIDLLKKCKIKKNKIYHNGVVLTSEALRQVIEMTMMQHGVLGEHTIVACGRQAADPHCRGFGPLYAHQTIVMDVFPRCQKTGYYGDISRTVLKGVASESLKKMYRAVAEAQKAGIRMIRHGVDASAVHNKVAETLRQKGFETSYNNGKPQGFIHSTGHGLGLDVHELPRISKLPNKLYEGNVVTVEPGLYYEKLGGVRIEDVVYVTKTGCEVLSKIPKVFEIS